MEIADLSLREFLDGVASARIAPSAGAVAAVTGASGAALGEMGCIHTIRDTDAEEENAGLTGRAEELHARRNQLLELAGEDASAVADLRAVADRDEASDAAQERAAKVPLEIANECLAVLETLGTVCRETIESVTPDVAVGIGLVYSALRAAAWLIRVNLDFIAEPSLRSELAAAAADLRESARTVVDEIETTLDEGHEIPFG